VRYGFAMPRAMLTSPPPSRSEDGVVVLHDVNWSEYEAILSIRGEHAGLRLTYLEGELEPKSPSIQHEALKRRSDGSWRPTPRSGTWI